jgi:DNA-binding XRE family transcriptional regulator
MSLKDFSRRLKAIRKARSMSQSDLAKACGLEPSAVSHFETGRRAPNLTNLVKLADALKTSADELLGIQTAIQKLRESTKCPCPCHWSMQTPFGKVTPATECNNCSCHVKYGPAIKLFAGAK